MSNVKDWLDENKLSLHLGKTESILFGSKRNIKKQSSLNVLCNDVNIESTTTVKYLGAVLEQDMSGNIMGQTAIKKINSGLKFLYRKANFLGKKERKLLCTSLLQARFDYGFNVWYRSSCKDIRSKLQCA